MTTAIKVKQKKKKRKQRVILKKIEFYNQRKYRSSDTSTRTASSMSVREKETNRHKKKTWPEDGSVETTDVNFEVCSTQEQQRKWCFIKI